MRVTVIPSDKLVMVDGLALQFDFPAPKELHALQWYEDRGEIEYDGASNQVIQAEDYDEYVKPFVDLFFREKDRVDEEQKKEAEEYQKWYNSEEQRFVRLREERDKRIAATDFLVMPDYPISEDKLADIRLYRTALRDITESDGAPWDGGGEKTPWPVNPMDK